MHRVDVTGLKDEQLRELAAIAGRKIDFGDSLTVEELLKQRAIERACRRELTRRHERNRHSAVLALATLANGAAAIAAPWCW